MPNDPTDAERFADIEARTGLDLSKMSADETELVVRHRTEQRIAERAASREAALISTAQRELTELGDSTDDAYQGPYKHLLPSQRQDRIDEIHARLAAEGLSLPERPTPEQRAIAQLDRQFGRDLDPFIAGEVEQRAADIEAKGNVDAAIAELQAQLGRQEYERALSRGQSFGNLDRNALARRLGAEAHAALVARAKRAFPDNFTLPKGVLADGYSLKQLAAYGDYVQRGERAYAKVKGNK